MKWPLAVVPLVIRPMRVAGMTSMMSSVATSVATRVTAMAARVATSMSSSGVPSSACKYRRRTGDKDYAAA